jgi:hypothetical protein
VRKICKEVIAVKQRKHARSPLSLLLTFILFVLTTSCGLSRGSALDLIKKKETACCDITARVSLFSSLFGVLYGSDEKLWVRLNGKWNRLEPAEGQEASDFALLPHDGSIPAGFATQFSEGKFTEILVKEGLLRRSRILNTSLTAGESANAIAVNYEIVPAPDVKQINFGNQAAAFTVGKAYFDHVTGISEGGDSASVDVEIRFTPTPLVEKLQRCLKKLTEQEHVDLSGGIPDLPGYAGVSAALRQIELAKSRTYTLQKYDDGWRVR